MSPKGHEKEWKRCVTKVKKKGNVDNPYAVCTASVLGKTKRSKSSKKTGSKRRK